MRHSIYGKKLSRDTNQRTALFKSLIQSLILSEKIQTTKAKAQAIKGLVDRLVTQAKSPSTRRLVSQFLTDKKIYNKFITDITPRLHSRNSGYTSVVKIGFRQGDGSMMVQMRLLLEDIKASKPDAKKALEKSTPDTSAVELTAQVAKKPIKSKRLVKSKKETK